MDWGIERARRVVDAFFGVVLPHSPLIGYLCLVTLYIVWRGITKSRSHGAALRVGIFRGRDRRVLMRCA